MALYLLILTLSCGSSGALMEVAPSEVLTVCTAGPADGDPVVLVPGLSGCAYGFRNLTPLLHEQGFRTIIIEPLAVGESSRPKNTDYTMTAQADRIGRVLDDLAVRQAIFIGQGIGGAMVFRLAVERPELLSGFVSVEAGAAEAAISPNTSNSLRLAKAVARLGGKSLLRDRFVENLKRHCLARPAHRRKVFPWHRTGHIRGDGCLERHDQANRTLDHGSPADGNSNSGGGAGGSRPP